MANLNNFIIKDKRFYYNQLFYDYLFNFGHLEDFYHYDYRLTASYHDRTRQVLKNYNQKYRKKLAGALKKYNGESGAGQKTLKNIGKLSKENSLMVVGGQQPVFLGGPLFMIYKAITVIKLSACLKQELGVEVIPCFWNASDDSNISQVDHINIVGRDLKNISIKGLPENIRYSDLDLNQDQIDEIIGQLDKSLIPTDFKQNLVDFIGESLNCAGHNGKISFSKTFSSFMLKLFSRWGLVIIDPAMEEIKQLSSDLIEKDIDLGIKAGELVDDAGARLKNSGYHAQLKNRGEYLNFFVTRDGNRKKIKADGRQYRWEGQTFNSGQIKEKIAGCMSGLSFNVVLRPIIQDSLFPVVATVCGPGEISYFAQLGPAYKLYGVQMPVIYPRFSATLIEKSVNKSLEKYGIDYQYIWEELGFIEKLVLKRHMNVDINRAVQDLNSKITENIEEAEKALSESLMNISSAFDRIKRNINRETTVLDHKLYSQYKKQNQHIKKAVEKIKLNLLPHGNMQEREISVISYINKYDFRLIDEIYNEFRCFDFGHKMIEVGEWT